MSAAKGKAKGKTGGEVGCGLVASEDGRAIPLRGVRVRARVEGMLARVTVEQAYRNAEAVPVEAVYTFPLPEGAAVDRVVMAVGERRIVAKALGRDEAFEAYDDAMAEGHGALLVDQERPNVFTASLGNLLPDQEVTVEVSYVSELAWEGNALRFLLPTTVAPRYAPEADRAGVSPTPAEAVSPPVAPSVPYGLDLRVEVSLPAPVKSVESPSHAVRVEVDGVRATVSLSAEEAALDRDFVVLLEPSEANFPWVRVEPAGEGRTCAAVALVPRLAPSQGQGTEVVFLVDRSGSMEGSSMEQVRRALQLCLRSLREGDRFDIVGFGSNFAALFGDARPYTQENLDRASHLVDMMAADMGGTELLPALKNVLGGRRPKDASRQVILLTDGEVTNEGEVLELASHHASHARIFVFGIGYGPSEYLVKGLARVSGGASEFIHPGERIEPKVLRQFARVAQPAVTDARVEWEGGKVSLRAPSEPGALFDGEPFLAYAIWKGEAPRRITLRGNVGGEEISWSADVPPETSGPEPIAAPLTARALIREMEEGRGRSGSARTDRTAKRRDADILELALAHNLVSSRTSMVAVEEREAAGDRKPAELRRVPVALTYGWGGADLRPMNLSGVVFCKTRPSVDVADAFCDSMETLPSAPLFRTTRDSGMIQRAARSLSGFRFRRAGIEERAQPGPLPLPPMDVVVGLQRANGSWDLTGELARALGCALDGMKSLAGAFGGACAESAVATAAALVWLELHAADREVEWRLLAEKAEAWLATALAGLPAVLSSEELARRVRALLAPKP